jgi:hypothetical protein
MHPSRVRLRALAYKLLSPRCSRTVFGMHEGDALQRGHVCQLVGI